MSILLYPSSLQQLGLVKEDAAIAYSTQYEMKEVNRWDIFMMHLWPRSGFLNCFDSTSDSNCPNNLYYSNEDIWEYPRYNDWMFCQNTLTLYKIQGITKDSGGSPLGNCLVHLFRTIDDSKQDTCLSDAAGNYLVYTPFTDPHYCVAYQTPNLTGATPNTLTGS